MPQTTRREWLSAALATALPAPGTAAPPVRLPLGFSLYGMKSLPLPDALDVCKRCGYDGVELALMPGYHADPDKLMPADVKTLTKLLADANLSVLGLMENLPVLCDAAAHRKNLDRLKSAADLGCALVPDRPPPIETVLGGKPADWDKVKDRLADRLADWAAVGRDRKTVIAVKPHVANALHAVADAAWLVKQVGSEWIRLAFDFSHFELRGGQDRGRGQGTGPALGVRPREGCEGDAREVRVPDPRRRRNRLPQTRETVERDEVHGAGGGGSELAGE